MAVVTKVDALTVFQEFKQDNIAFGSQYLKIYTLISFVFLQPALDGSLYKGLGLNAYGH